MRHTAPPRDHARLVDPDALDLDADAQPVLAVDAQPADIASRTIERVAEPATAAEQDPVAPRSHDTGELYGVRTPHAFDTALAASEDHDAFEGAERGETWLEALEEHAALMGPVPEEEIVIVDDRDLEHTARRPSERDRPVADKGAGGVGGL